MVRKYFNLIAKMMPFLTFKVSLPLFAIKTDVCSAVAILFILIILIILIIFVI